MCKKKRKSVLGLLLLLLLLPSAAEAQKLIQYEAGLGRRLPGDADTWVLCREVRAEHEGMVLYADSALLNTKSNTFTAYYGIEILLTDTTFIYGNELYYDGITRMLDIWDDTVLFIDGSTVLYTDHLTFDRNANKAYYDTWGHTVNGVDTLDSYTGIYDATSKEVYIYGEVVLRDSASRLLTDTLLYHVRDEVADFRSPTHIYSDTATLYSTRGSYFTKQRYALSTKDSYVKTGTRTLICDTLHYYENEQYGRAISHVFLYDSVNDIACRGHYGESDQKRRTSFVTDSALVTYVRDLDTLFLHADTVRVENTEDNEVRYIQACHRVRLYRSDVQAVCDSAFYDVCDSIVWLHRNPILWQNVQQCSADTILLHTSAHGVRQADLNGHCFIAEQVDSLKFNQVKGNDAKVYFAHNDPAYADIMGNAEMLYYITEEAGPEKQRRLIGVNLGVGSDMRIYFNGKQPSRVVTYHDPDMYAYPLDKLPADKQHLPGFVWQDASRPHSKQEIF